MSKFVFPLDKVSAPDTELLELGFPLYCGPKNQFQHANNNLHPSERGRTCRDGSHKYLCVCLWLKCWLRTFALTYSYTCISWSGSGHEITPPSHDTDAGALLQAAPSLYPLGHSHCSSSFKYSNCGLTNWLQKAKIVNTLNLRQSGWTTCKSWSWYEPVGERARTPLPLLYSRDRVKSGMHWLHFS